MKKKSVQKDGKLQLRHVRDLKNIILSCAESETST